LSAGLHLVSASSLLVDLALLPALLVGGWVGAQVIRRIDQRHFELVALCLGGLAGLLLVV
jgi:uncharacterized protein